MSNEKVSLGGYQKIYSELKQSSYANVNMQSASQAIEELDLDELAFEELAGRISSNAKDAKEMDFINKENLHLDNGAWTNGTLTFEKRDDGTYKILKIVDGMDEPIAMGFTDQEGVDAYYAALNSLESENTGGELAETTLESTIVDETGSIGGPTASALKDSRDKLLAYEAYTTWINNNKDAVSDITKEKAKIEFLAFNSKFGKLTNYSDIIGNTEQLPDWMADIVSSYSK